MQVLLEKMKYDTYWDKVSMSYELIQLLAVTEKTILAHTKYQYSFATV